MKGEDTRVEVARQGGPREERMSRGIYRQTFAHRPCSYDADLLVGGR